MFEVRDIRPVEMEIYHRYPLDAYTCYLIHTGTCALDESQSNSSITKSDSPYHRIEYCQLLYEAIKRHAVEPIKISLHECGHYSASDGRHRVCIAKRKKISLAVHIYKEEGKCCKCLGGGIGTDKTALINEERVMYE